MHFWTCFFRATIAGLHESAWDAKVERKQLQQVPYYLHCVVKAGYSENFFEITRNIEVFTDIALESFGRLRIHFGSI